MEIYIHFGIYKAGSSYLQYIAANRRSELVQQGVWFPFSQDEQKMLTGQISAGNAFTLSERLGNNDWRNIERYFLELKREAKENNCNKILLSAEALVHQLAVKDKINQLAKVLDDLDFDVVHALGFFRDLVDHCISLYKHRSKSGKNIDFKYWVDEIYETPKVLNAFFENHILVDFQWSLLKFKKDSEYMAYQFFKEWLGVEIGDLPDQPKVNESITLSEVKVMQAFRNFYPKTYGYLLSQFIGLPKNEKANDKEIENGYLSIASGILYDKYNRDSSKWVLSNGQKLEIERINRQLGVEFFSTIQLSNVQIGIMINSGHYLAGMSSYKLRFEKYIKGLLPKKIVKFLVSLR